jgi:MFS family permease
MTFEASDQEKPAEAIVAWLRDLTPTERKTMLACFGGWTLDAFDAQVFSFIIPTLLTLWGISNGQAGLLATSTLVISAFGGWAAGALSDRVGRVRVLQVTIIWYALFAFLSGFSQNFEQLFVCRALQGLGFGGEWSAGAVLIGEVIRNRYRGRAVGFVQAGWAVGWGAAALLYTLLFTTIPEAQAWRIMFWIGLAPALLVIWIRRNIQESEIYRARGAERKGLEQVFSVLKQRYLPLTLKLSTMVAGAQAGTYTISIWLPTYLKTVRGLSIENTGSFLLLHISCALLGYVGGAYTADMIGRKWTFITAAIGSSVLILVYMVVPLSNTAVFFLGAPLGFIVYSMFAPMGSYMTELYPTPVRGCGQGFCYNFGRAVGALFPALTGFLSEQLGLGAAIAVFAVAAYGTMVIALLMLPETIGRPLESIDSAAA